MLLRLEGPTVPEESRGQIIPLLFGGVVREVLGLPLYAWTVRGEDDVRTAARWADAPIFEGW